MHHLPLLFLWTALIAAAAGGSPSASKKFSLSSEAPQAVSNETAEDLNNNELLERHLGLHHESSSRLTQQWGQQRTRTLMFCAAVAATLAAVYIFYRCFRGFRSQKTKRAVSGTRRLAAGGPGDSDEDGDSDTGKICTEGISPEDDETAALEESIQATAELAEQAAAALARKQEDLQRLSLQAKKGEASLRDLKEQVEETEKVLEDLRAKAAVAEKVLSAINAKAAEAAEEELLLQKELAKLNSEFADKQSKLLILSERKKEGKEEKPAKPKPETQPKTVKKKPKSPKSPKGPESRKPRRKGPIRRFPKPLQAKRWSTHGVIPDYDMTEGTPSWAIPPDADGESSGSEEKAAHPDARTPESKMESPSEEHDAGPSNAETGDTSRSPEDPKAPATLKVSDLRRAHESDRETESEFPPSRPSRRGPAVASHVLSVMKQLAQSLDSLTPPRPSSPAPRSGPLIRSNSFLRAKSFFEKKTQATPSLQRRQSFSGVSQTRPVKDATGPIPEEDPPFQPRPPSGPSMGRPMPKPEDETETPKSPASEASPLPEEPQPETSEDDSQ